MVFTSRQTERAFRNEEAAKQNSNRAEKIAEIKNQLAESISILEEFKSSGGNVWELPTGPEFEKYLDAAENFLKAVDYDLKDAVLRQELSRFAREIINAESTMKQ